MNFFAHPSDHTHTHTKFHEHIFTCLAAILHLGNVTFTEDDDEYSHITDPQSGPLKTISVSNKINIAYSNKHYNPYLSATICKQASRLADNLLKLGWVSSLTSFIMHMFV